MWQHIITSSHEEHANRVNKSENAAHKHWYQDTQLPQERHVNRVNKSEDAAHENGYEDNGQDCEWCEDNEYGATASDGDALPPWVASPSDELPPWVHMLITI